MMKAREDMDTKVRNKKTWEGENQKEKKSREGDGNSGPDETTQGGDGQGSDRVGAEVTNK